MTGSHILDVIFRASVWRALHGVSPLVAAGIAVLVIGIGIVRR